MSLYHTRPARKHAAIPYSEQLDAADLALRGTCDRLRDVSRIFVEIERDGRGPARRRARRVQAAIAHALIVLRAGGAPP
jgi:hypothetical protein